MSPSAAASRLEAKTSFVPSGENIGKPSNVPLKVIRSSPEPSTPIRNRSKLRPSGLCRFDEKMMRSPSGCQYGAKLAPPKSVTCRRLLPSASITNTSTAVGRHSPRSSSRL